MLSICRLAMSVSSSASRWHLSTKPTKMARCSGVQPAEVLLATVAVGSYETGRPNGELARQGAVARVLTLGHGGSPVGADG